MNKGSEVGRAERALNFPRPFFHTAFFKLVCSVQPLAKRGYEIRRLIRLEDRQSKDNTDFISRGKKYYP